MPGRIDGGAATFQPLADGLLPPSAWMETKASAS
jgi:hypothetical protein